MDFNLKIQNIGEQTDIFENSYSITHEFDEPDADILESRGQLYIVASIHASERFDIKAAMNIFIDSVRESYYKRSDETPLKAMENALNKSYQTLFSFKSNDEKDTLSSENAQFKLTFCTALIWNRILYTSYLGNPAAYLIRGSGARDLGSKSSDIDIWTNSGILEHDDVVIIGTEAFASKFPPTEIINELGGISQKIAVDENRDLLPAMLIKVTSTEDMKKTKMSDRFKNANLKGSLSTTIWKVKDKISNNDTLSDKFKFYQSKKAAPISSISSLSGNTQSESSTSVSNERSHKRIHRIKKKDKKLSRMIVGLLILGVFGFLNYRLLYKESPKTTVDDIKSHISNLNAETIDQEIIGNVMGDNDNENDEPIKTESMHTLLVSTPDLVDDMVPAAIASVEDDGLILVDAETGTAHIYEYEDETEIKTAVKGLEGFDNISCDEKLCYAYANETLFVFNPRLNRTPDKYLMGDIGQVIDLYTYGNRVYLLTPSQIYAFTLRGTAPTEWLDENTKLQSAKSLAIFDGVIYVLENGSISKYREGKKDESFEIDSSNLLSPNQLEVTEDYLYVLDDTKKAIVVFNKSGEFIEDIGLAESTDFEAPSMFSISKNSAEDIIFRKGKNIYIAER